MAKPYISFVIAGRNDDYGGDFNYRLENSIQNLAYLIEKYKLPAEYIVSNYNPLPDKPPLRTAIQWPTDRRYLKIKIVTTPPELHRQFVNPSIRDTVPLFEYIAKNIGIRRAAGEYICAANPDIIYHPGIIRHIARRKLREDTYYRVDRCDFNRFETLRQLSQEKLIPELQKRTFRVFLKGHTYYREFPNFFNLRLNWLRWKNRIRLKKEIKSNPEAPPERFYHCNCSGDFITLHHRQWLRLKGNPEFTRVAAHTDALFVVIAATAGLKEYVYPWPVFHQNHDRRYECDAEEVNPSVEWMYKWYVQKGHEMMRTGKPLVNAHDDWGLNNVELPVEEF